MHSFLKASISKNSGEEKTCEQLLCGWELLVDECEGCSVGDAARLRPEQSSMLLCVQRLNTKILWRK